MDLISIEILNNDVLRKQEDNELLNDLNVEENLKENENEANNNEDIQDEEEEQDDLTNLAWLTELRNQRHNSILYSGEFEYETTTINTGLGTGTTQLINADDDYNTTTTTTSTTLQNDMPKIFQKQQQHHQQNSIDGKQQQTQKTTIKRPTPMERFETFCKKVKRDLAEYEKSSIEYQTMEADKPPFNYSHIIGMVMLEKGRVTLQQICAWIELKFAYFRTRKKWNNSIRHNLSLHPCFRKIDRKKYEKGKGGYWELGIDLKKCERKRIRHRKNAQKQQKVQQQEQQQNNDIDHDLMNGDVSEKDLEFVDDELNGEPQTHQQQNDTEFLLDDEFDVQQNIDITSCCHKQQQQQQHEQHEQNIHFIEQQQPQLQQQQQQFQLGTIIISGGGESPTSCSSFVTTTPLQSTNWQNYYEITDTPITLKNRPNVIVEEIHTTSHQQQQQQQQHRSLLLANLLSPTITTNTTTVTGAAGTTKTFNHQFDGDGEENVVTTTSSNNNDISFFQPITSTTTTTTEIDSIEEAFQYLRSLDTNNRDDSFLDNFFDVSVSDF